jgi:hypothetical protein
MVGAIRNSLSYIVASPFMALWQLFGDKMGTTASPSPRCKAGRVYSPECVEGEFCELRLYGVLRSC